MEPVAPPHDPIDDVSLEPYVVTISRNEYESFKDRLFSIEAKINREFNITKLDAVKTEMGQNDRMLNGPEKVENKFNQTLLETEKLLQNKAENVARRLYRDIRQGHEYALVRSPSERKIGSLRRRSRSRLSRTQSCHLGQSSPARQRDDSNLISTASFYPKINLKRGIPVQILSTTSRPLPALPAEPIVEKVIPEKPLRVTRMSSTPQKAAEAWTPAESFFSDLPMETDEQPTDQEIFFKTPVRPKRLSTGKSAIKHNDLQTTPMLPPRSTPVNTPSSTPNRSQSFNKTIFLTPSLHDKSQGRDSIIVLRNKNAGMVAQKAKLFNGLSDKGLLNESVKIPRVIINKNLENVKNMSSDDSPRKRHNVPSAMSPRRSTRSPGIVKRNQFKATTQSPLLKTIREVSDSQRQKLLKPDILDEIASPKRKRSTPNKTPNRGSGKKFRHSPVKSRYVRHK